MDTAFSLAFIPLSLRRRGLLHIHNKPGASTAFWYYWSNKEGGSLWQCITHCWSELVDQHGWHSAGWVGQGTKSRLKQKLKQKQTQSHSFSSSFSDSHHFCSSVSLLDALGKASSLYSVPVLLGTCYPKHILQCCVKVMCWLTYQEFSLERNKWTRLRLITLVLHPFSQIVEGFPRPL